ncbi:MAG: 4-hydroxy-tetrahydrodipicolinate synthase [Gemmatimonadota bacterium]|nr:4-hydroxy-tetrahydrodipicolinate synthase [Gemmatimonadota bacterium]
MVTATEQRDSSSFEGVGVALITPFKEDRSVDMVTYRDHVEFQIEHGVQVLVPCGSTGESLTLSAQEQQSIIREAVDTARGRATVLAGAGGSNTADVIKRARAARKAGADGILSVSPAYNKPSQRGLIEHYRALADAVDCPIVIYNVPGRTASNVLPETVLELAEVENIVGVKEASGDMEQAMTLLKARPERFVVLSGEDSLTFPLMAAGADGVISVVANEAPLSMSQMVVALLEGEFDRARELHYRLLPLMLANFVETNPVPVKAALELMGRMKARYRLPLVPAAPESKVVLRNALIEAGVLEEVEGS